MSGGSLDGRVAVVTGGAQGIGAACSRKLVALGASVVIGDRNLAAAEALAAELGDRAAAIYSLLGTAKLNGINPQRYLRYVLERIADHPSDRIDELLPWAVAANLADDAHVQDLPMAA